MSVRTGGAKLEPPSQLGTHVLADDLLQEYIGVITRKCYFFCCLTLNSAIVRYFIRSSSYKDLNKIYMHRLLINKQLILDSIPISCYPIDILANLKKPRLQFISIIHTTNPTYRFVFTSRGTQYIYTCYLVYTIDWAFLQNQPTLCDWGTHW